MKAQEAFAVKKGQIVTQPIDRNLTPHTELSPDSPTLDIKTKLMFKAVTRQGHQAKIVQCAVGHEWDVPTGQVLPQRILVIAQ
jgi:hypothetical protein